MEPTYENQVLEAEKLLAEKGVEELKKHAAVGRMCHCHDCFCCAALAVVQRYDRMHTNTTLNLG